MLWVPFRRERNASVTLDAERHGSVTVARAGDKPGREHAGREQTGARLG